jgi:hypothetical protein
MKTYFLPVFFLGKPPRLSFSQGPEVAEFFISEVITAKLKIRIFHNYCNYKKIKL